MVHPFHLAIGSGMNGFGQPMVNLMFMTVAIDDIVKGADITLPTDELDAVIGEYCVELTFFRADLCDVYMNLSH
jgi:hypothetical protein